MEEETANMSAEEGLVLYDTDMKKRKGKSL